MAGLGKLLLLVGGTLVILGLVLVAGARIPFLSQLGRLPGDLRIERPGFTLYLPIASSILVSVVLTVLFRIFFRR